MSKRRMKWLGGAFVLGTSGILLFLALVLPLSIASAQSRNTLECIGTEFTMPENSWVTDTCYTDRDGNCVEEVPESWAERLTGRIWYTPQDGAEQVLDLSLDHSFRYVWPMTVYVNEHFWGGLHSLVGHQFKEFKATRFECIYSPGSGPWMKMYTYWVVRAKLSEGGGGDGGGSGGGGGNASEPAQFEGFIDQISDQEVTIAKEGRATAVTVTDGTRITLNGNSATLEDLQVGDKVKATYDPDTSEALEIKAEAER